MTRSQLDNLHESIRNCRICVGASDCAMTDDSKRVLRASEPAAPGCVFVVAQALASRTQRLSGRPYRFVSGELSETGKRLESFLNQFGCTLGSVPGLRQVYSTDVVQCYPGRANNGKGDRKPSPAEIHNCSRWLVRELDELQPSAILTFGDVAKRAFDPGGPVAPPYRWGRPLLVHLPHPSYARWKPDYVRQKYEAAASMLRDALSRIGIEYTEVHEAEYKAVARRHSVALRDESGKSPPRMSSREDSKGLRQSDATREEFKAHFAVSGGSTDDNSTLPNRAPCLEQTASPSQFSRAVIQVRQVDIVNAILGAYPYNQDGKGLSFERQRELFRRVYDAKLSDGRNAFPAMHGGAEREDAPKSWEGGARRKGGTRRKHMNTLAKRGQACSVDGRNLYMLAEGVTPAAIGVRQELVDALAAHDVIRWYDVNGTTHAAPK